MTGPSKRRAPIPPPPMGGLPDIDDGPDDMAAELPPDVIDEGALSHHVTAALQIVGPLPTLLAELGPRRAEGKDLAMWEIAKCQADAQIATAHALLALVEVGRRMVAGTQTRYSTDQESFLAMLRGAR